MLAGIYLSAVLAHIIGRLMPQAQVWTFAFLSVLWVLIGVSVIIRELHHGRPSLAELGIGTLPPVIVGSATVLLIARIVAHYEPAPMLSVVIGEWGLIFWIGGYLLLMRDAYHQKKLDEDLANKPSDAVHPPKSSNQAMQPTADHPDV
jgi:hypothetical protein